MESIGTVLEQVLYMWPVFKIKQLCSFTFGQSVLTSRDDYAWYSYVPGIGLTRLHSYIIANSERYFGDHTK